MTTERDIALIWAALDRYLDQPETILAAFNATEVGRGREIRTVETAVWFALEAAARIVDPRNPDEFGSMSNSLRKRAKLIRSLVPQQFIDKVVKETP